MSHPIFTGHRIEWGDGGADPVTLKGHSLTAHLNLPISCSRSLVVPVGMNIRMVFEGFQMGGYFGLSGKVVFKRFSIWVAIA